MQSEVARVVTEPTPISPDLQALLSSSGIDINSLLTQQPAPTSQADIASALLQSAMAVSKPYNQALPWWAQSLQGNLISEDQFGKVYQAKEGLVYLGTGGQRTVSTPANKFAEDMGGPSTTTTLPANRDYAATVTQAMNLPYTWDEREVADAIQRLKSAGIQVDSFDMGSNSLVNVWGSLVNRAAQTYALTDGERKLTPWDVLDLYKNEADASGIGPFSGSKTTVQRNVTEISEGEAWAQLQNNLSQMLGRDPSDQEMRDFTYRMNQLAARNPAISKTITQYKNGEAVSSSTHTDPGFTGADMAQEAYDSAQNDPEYAEYRGASLYFNALMSALGPIGG